MARSQWNTRCRAPGSLKKLISVIPTATGTSATEAARCAIAVRRTRWCFLSVVPRGNPDLVLPEAVPPLDHYSQQ
ncbi:hypothetical protein TNCV_2454671 [Trichonephila clavipes]|nr:hypothetical protein TNCV_2454671 [Trichonephila clavipes]